MKRQILLLAAIFFAVFVIGSIGTPGEANAGPVKLSYANFPPPVTFPCVQMERWKDEVEKRTNGKVVINTFPGSTLLGPKDMMDGVIAGTADIGNLCQAYQPGRFVLSNATALPLGIPNARVGSMVLWDLYRKYNFEPFNKVKVLTMFTTAPSNIMSKVPIRNLNDIQGVSLRASGGAAQILKVWGANQIGMPMSATPEALQKGTVQGLFSSLEVMKDFKFAELCKYVTMTQTPIYPFAVVMNMEKWNSLPKDVQKVMEDLGTEQAEWTGTYMDKIALESVAWSKANQGVEFIEPSDKAQWDKKLEPIVDAWIAKKEKEGVPAKEIVADIRALIKKYAE
ncbi:MAG: TRAP transporter substrate-binding protein [Deltaproteobacteria bacterium]|nr:TRAP transporter substrate-binding protein [Deltaproteobacteria bacterium]